MSKRYFRDASTFKSIAVGLGSCIASDRIVVDGALVGLMYREEPDHNMDSGWRFLCGDESEKYLENPQNFGVFDVNTISNYDPLICQHLDASIGASFVRKGDVFVLDDKFEPTDK